MSRITAAKVTSASNQKDNFKTLQKKYELLSNKNTERCINTTVQTLRSIFFYSISNYQGFLINGQIKHIKNIKNILEENTSLSLTSSCGCAPPPVLLLIITDVLIPTAVSVFEPGTSYKYSYLYHVSPDPPLSQQHFAPHCTSTELCGCFQHW